VLRDVDHDKAAYADLQGLEASRTFNNTEPLLLRNVGSRGHDVLVVPTLNRRKDRPDHASIILDTHGRTSEVRDPDHVLYAGADGPLNLRCGAIDALPAQGVALDASVRTFLERRCRS
jgi:hypothetical protein